MKHHSVLLALTGATAFADTPVLGEITIANSAQGYAGSLAQDVVGYLAGQPADNHEDLLDLICPPVQTGDFFQFAKAADEAFLTESDNSDIRAHGASFKRIEHTGELVTDATQQKGLTKRVDHRSIPVINGSRISGWENREAEALKRRLIRAELLRASAVLDAAANSNNKTWNAGSNPDGDLRGIVDLSRTKLGIQPNRVLMGRAAAMLRKDALEAASRANHAMSNRAGWTYEELAQYLSVDQVILHDAVTQSKKGATKTAIMGLACYSYYAEEIPTLDDPSNLKRAWSATLSGQKWAVFIQEGPAWTDITVFHQSKIFSPITTGVEKIVVAAA
jgi:hypothetical protein